MTTCADPRAKQALRSLFEGSLNAEGFSHLRAHVAACSECRETYERLSRVESALEHRALPAQRQALLEQELFARLNSARARAPKPERPRFSLAAFWAPAMAGLAVAGGLVMGVLLPSLSSRAPDEGWGSRGGTESGAWGVRAFCVDAGGGVRAEARSGETLVCEEGSAVQFLYTAPAAARLSVETTSATGEPLRFFPEEGTAREVTAGVDVALPHSTPVQAGWLSGPLEVRARFSDAGGRVLSETRLTLAPR